MYIYSQLLTESRLFDWTINFFIIISSYNTHVYSTPTISPSITETTIMNHGMILSPIIYNVNDQYDVYMNILLIPSPPLVVLLVVAVVDVDGTKVDCVTNKTERH